MKRGWILIGLVGVAGCQVEPPPDPNDPAQVGVLQPIVMRRQLLWASDAANMRVAKGEFTRDQAKLKVAEVAQEMLRDTPIERIPPGSAWEYAEIFRTARQWKEAVPIFRVAIEHAKTEDRRINDTLRLAHCLAELGQVKEAIQEARKTLNAKPVDSAPLLPAVLFEIAPAGRGKGHNRELAKLLRDVIPIYERTVVDETKDEGQEFVRARPFLISKAFDLIRELEADRS